jgi:5S rRNA maturation endonuclease (ribonuclease M5)
VKKTVETVKQDEKNFEELSKVLDYLKEDDRTKIVEGEKDKRALEYFGITNVRMIHGNSLPRLTSSIKNDAILLVDFDRTGRILARKIADLLRNESIHVDLDYRRNLRRYAKINNIEELVVKYNNLEEKIRSDLYGKNLHRYSKVRSLCSLRDRWGSGETGRGGRALRAD